MKHLKSRLLQVKPSHIFPVTMSITSRWAFSIAVSLLILSGGIYYAYMSKRSDISYTKVTISSYSMQTDDLRALAQKSDLVVEGIIKEVRPSVWTTPDGLPPADVSLILNNLNIQLRTPILVSVDHSRKGDVVGDLLFTTIGGESSQYKVEVEDDQPIAVGSRVVIFLSKAPADAGPWAKISPYYPQLYFVVNGDKLVGPQKAIERSELDRQVPIKQEGN